MDLVTETSEAQRADAWNPDPSLFSWTGFAVFAFWTILQPVLDIGLLREQRWVGFLQWMLGTAVICLAVFVRRYRQAAPYRFVLAAARSEHPESLVFGIRLDPLTTPVDAQWGESQKIRWGMISVSPNGVRIVRSDGVVILLRPWSEFEFSTRGIEVTTSDGIEEWWFRLLSESGIWPRPIVVRRSRSRMVAMAALRPTSPIDKRPQQL